MSVVLTHECNMKCPFCIDEYRGRCEYISMTDVLKAIEFAKEKNIKDILLIGGEPTLHPRVLDIAMYFKKAGFRVIMTTNYTNPEVVKQLDGIVDCFNISYYNQKELPRQKDFKSDLTINTIIHKKQLSSKIELDAFIEKYKEYAHLKFMTLMVHNEWTQRNTTDFEFLNDLDCEWVVLFNELLGQKYKGTIIKRYDRIINKHSHQSYKFHVDGKISQTWERELSPKA